MDRHSSRLYLLLRYRMNSPFSLWLRADWAHKWPSWTTLCSGRAELVGRSFPGLRSTKSQLSSTLLVEKRERIGQEMTAREEQSSGHGEGLCGAAAACGNNILLLCEGLETFSFPWPKGKENLLSCICFKWGSCFCPFYTGVFVTSTITHLVGEQAFACV